MTLCAAARAEGRFRSTPNGNEENENEDLHKLPDPWVYVDAVLLLSHGVHELLAVFL